MTLARKLQQIESDVLEVRTDLNAIKAKKYAWELARISNNLRQAAEALYLLWEKVEESGDEEDKEDKG